MAKNLRFHHYLPVTEHTMQWGFYLTGAGRDLTARAGRYPGTTHPALYQFRWERGRILPEFAMLLIADGSGEFESRETGHVELETDSAIFLLPGVWHRYRPHERAGYAERWITFNGELAYRLMNEGYFTAETAVRPAKDPTKLIGVFDALLERIDANPAQNPILLAMHGMALLANAIESVGDDQLPIVPSNADVTDDDLVNRAIDLVWSTSHQPLSVPQLSDALGVNRRTLERRFRKARGYPILEEINRCRCNRAKRLLKQTDLPVKRVAYQAGFASANRLRAAFASLEGMSPSAYREQLRKRE